MRQRCFSYVKRFGGTHLKTYISQKFFDQMVSMKIILVALVMTYTHAQHRNLTELIMRVTGGVGCDENEHFSFHSQNAICCEEDSEDNPNERLAPNVCWEPRMTKINIAGCSCNKGFDLINRGIKQLIVVK